MSEEQPEIIANEDNRIIRLSKTPASWFSIECLVIGQGEAPVVRKEIRLKREEALLLAKALLREEAR